ncbi:MAG: cobalamin B12-binding domain-containing protein [Eubacteriaceae bacterium]
MEYKLIEYVKELDVNSAKLEVENMLNNNVSPKEIQRQMLKGLYEVGQKYESGDCYIGDLIVSGMLMKEILALEKMKDSLLSSENICIGKVLIGTVCDDIHDIGKDILIEMLTTGGFKVLDLGVDVSPKKFVKEIISFQPDIVGISCILTTSINYVFQTIKEIEKEGLRNKVKIIVGGAAINKKYFSVDIADALTNDAYEGLNICKTWISDKKGVHRKG